MTMRLTVLCENSVERVNPAGLLGEHGFSCHLETKYGNFLFDTGGGQTILNNSEKMQIDLRQLQGVIFSHGHLDHTGGLQQVLQLAGSLPVYAHPELFQTRHSSNGEQLRAIGIPWSRTALEKLGADFRLATAPQQIAPGLILSGEIPRLNRFETGDPNLVTINASGQKIVDPLADDLSLFIDSPKGLIILLGCAHAGLLNIIEHARKVTGQDKIYLLLGGTHLKFSGEEQLKATLGRLEELNIEQLGVSHCTGLRQAQILAERFGNRFFNATVGTEVLIED